MQKEWKGMEIAGGQIESWVEAGNKPFRRGPHPPASPPRVAAQPATQKHRKC